jgi:hypothetical protein
MKAECSSDTVLQPKTQTWPFQDVVLDFGAFCSFAGRYQRSFSPEDGDCMFFSRNADTASKREKTSTSYRRENLKFPITPSISSFKVLVLRATCGTANLLRHEISEG